MQTLNYNVSKQNSDHNFMYRQFTCRKAQKD